MFVTLVLAHNIAMKVNKQVSFGALHPLSLIGSVKRPTIDASMELVIVLFKQEL